MHLREHAQEDSHGAAKPQNAASRRAGHGYTRGMAERVAMLTWRLAASWCVMVMTHEAGHLLGGWIGGATLVDFDLAPWGLPYSIHQPDPRPLLTLWAGPIVGVALPVAVALAAHRAWVWFIADFCVLANGAYLAIAWVGGGDRLDTPRLLAAGAPAFVVAVFCAATIAVGYVRFRSDLLGVLSRRGACRSRW